MLIVAFSRPVETDGFERMIAFLESEETVVILAVLYDTVVSDEGREMRREDTLVLSLEHSVVFGPDRLLVLSREG